ncbi:MAG: hypothetical protein M3R55_17315 [Acidobacteriota bacterium]|nr:hypothetical protein [Acidobacteriota bacterium]
MALDTAIGRDYGAALAQCTAVPTLAAPTNFRRKSGHQISRSMVPGRHCERDRADWFRSISAVNDRHLTIKALAMALGRRGPRAGLLHHSDQGSTPGLEQQGLNP